MGPLAEAVLLSVLLSPAFLLSRQDQGSQSLEPTRRLNVRFDPRRMRLTWDCPENSSVIRCEMLHKDEGLVRLKPKETDCHCTFQSYSLHGGANLTVTVNTSHRQMTESVSYSNPGAEGTAAQNFSCVVYNVEFMNCSWEKGPSAPDDVQYFLYIQDSKRQRQRECPRYVKVSGTHVGCHLQDLSGLTFHSHFLVNGTSRRAGIQFFDTILSFHKIERYNPPRNVTVHCNGSHCLVQWERPRTRRERLTDRDFLFQLDLQTLVHMQPSGNQLVEVSGHSGNKYSFLSPQPKARHTVRLRAADARLRQWGDWSQPVAFGSEEWEGSLVLIYVMVVLGTVVCALILGYVFKRFFRLHCLSPRIPQIKDMLNENHQTHQQIVWETLSLGAGKGHEEDVLTVQEVTESTATQ